MPTTEVAAALLTYGPLGIAVLGLSYAVNYLTRRNEALVAALETLHRERLADAQRATSQIVTIQEQAIKSTIEIADATHKLAVGVQRIGDRLPAPRPPRG